MHKLTETKSMGRQFCESHYRRSKCVHYNTVHKWLSTKQLQLAYNAHMYRKCTSNTRMALSPYSMYEDMPFFRVTDINILILALE